MNISLRFICFGLIFWFASSQMVFSQVDTLSSLPESYKLNFYSQMKGNISYPKLTKQEVKNGTCFLTIKIIEGKLATTHISNSLGIKFDKQITLGLQESKSAISYSERWPSYTAIIPITFGMEGANYVRTAPPSILCGEIQVINRNYQKRDIFQDYLLKEYQSELKNGNYSKALGLLDKLILLDPYKPPYRMDRIKILILLGENILACDDYIFLKNVIKYASYPTSPCEK